VRRGPGAVRCERVQTSAGSESAFVFPMPRGRQLAVTVLMLVITCGGVVVIGGWLGILCTALFGLFFLLSLHSLVRPQRLVLTPTRLMVSANLGTVELRWEAVRTVEIYAMPGGRSTAAMLGVAAKDPDAATWTRGRRFGRLCRRLSHYDLTVGAETVAGEPEDVVNAIRRYQRDARRRRAIGSEEEHARLLRELRETAAPA
jgi:hypothetical protein